MLANSPVGVPKIEPFFIQEPDISLNRIGTILGLSMEDLILSNPVFLKQIDFNPDKNLDTTELWGTINHIESILSQTQPSPVEFRMIPLKAIKKDNSPGEYANHLGIIVKPLAPFSKAIGTSIPLAVGDPTEKIELGGIKVDTTYYKRLYRLMDLTWNVISTDKVPLAQNIANFSGNFGILYPFLEGRLNCLNELIASNPKFENKTPEQANSMMTAWSLMGPQPPFEDMYRYLKNQ